MAQDYENYEVASLDYDKIRQAVGVEIILGALSVATRNSLKDLHILDAGCGTGNYVIAVSEFVAKVTGVELNEGMLRQSKRKTSHLTNVEILKGNILSLPFPDRQFDGVICNQVLHHLQPEDSSDYGNVGQCMREIYRVLKPKGAIIINTSTPEQSTTSLWFQQLISEVLQKKMAKKYPPLLELQRLMQETGFTVGPALTLNHETHVKSDILYDKEGPFRQEWRNGESSWSLLEPEELERTLSSWRKTIDEGKADDFIQTCEEHRMRIGSSLSVIGYK